MVGATGHLRHSLAKEVGGHEGRGQSMVGGSIAQLAVAIVAPCKNLSIYKTIRKLLYQVVSVVYILLTDKK